MLLVRCIAVAGLICSQGLGTVAQHERGAKSYQEWSEQQVTKLLNDSPWAKTQTIRIVPRKQMRSIAGQVSADPGAAGPVPTDGQAALGGAESAVDYNFTIRLRSALPIRQAIVRLVQIQADYDRMTPTQKKALDAQTKELLECRECADNYVISVGFGSVNRSGIDPVYDWFKGQSIESLRRYVYIQNDRGERRDLSAFIQPRLLGDEAFFLFARNDKDGKRLITPNHKRLLFKMTDADARSITNFTLDVSKMVVDGRVEF